MALCFKKPLTKKEAQEHLNHLLKKGNYDKGRIYPCNFHVGFWHITHKERFEKDEIGIKEVELTMKERWEALRQAQDDNQ